MDNTPMSSGTPETLNFDASELRFGIVAARYNKSLVDTVLQRTIAALQAAGAAEKNIRVLRYEEILHCAAYCADLLPKQHLTLWMCIRPQQ